MLGRTGTWLAAALFAGVIAAPATPALAQGNAAPSHETKRDEWQRVDEIFKAMQVKPGAVVADVGAGDGFFTTRLAEAVGTGGRVHAVDVNPVSLSRLKSRVAEAGLGNVEIVRGELDDPKLPAGSIDAALIVNAYHEMDEHQAMLMRIRAALKPGGRLVIVEPISESRKEQPRAEQTRRHEIGVDFVQADARAAGFAEVAVHDPFVSRPNGDVEWMLVLTPSANTAPRPPVERFTGSR
jgi:predicted methyltransferase